MLRRKGFTLIELLVVIAIIAVLAAILFPVFAQAREKARQTTCASNMRQMTTGFHMYKQDYDETYPVTNFLLSPTGGNRPWYGTEWQNALFPYEKNAQIYRCPSDAAPDMDPSNPASRGTTFPYRAPVSYLYNWNLGAYAGPNTIPTPIGKTDAAVQEPASKVLLMEGHDDNAIFQPPANGSKGTDFMGRISLFVNPYRINSLTNETATQNVTGIGTGHCQQLKLPRHSGRTGSNVAFCDGHVKFIRYTSAGDLQASLPMCQAIWVETISNPAACSGPSPNIRWKEYTSDNCLH